MKPYLPVQLVFTLFFIIFSGQFAFGYLPTSFEDADFALVDCDTLVLKSGTELAVEILDIDLLRVEYKKCGASTGNVFQMQFEKLTTIKFSKNSEWIEPFWKIKGKRVDMVSDLKEPEVLISNLPEEEILFHLRCDIILLKDGQEKIVEILYENAQEVTYCECGGNNENKYRIPHKKIRRIEYSKYREKASN